MVALTIRATRKIGIRGQDARGGGCGRRFHRVRSCGEPHRFGVENRPG